MLDPFIDSSFIQPINCLEQDEVGKNPKNVWRICKKSMWFLYLDPSQNPRPHLSRPCCTQFLFLCMLSPYGAIETLEFNMTLPLLNIVNRNSKKILITLITSLLNFFGSLTSQSFVSDILLECWLHRRNDLYTELIKTSQNF